MAALGPAGGGRIHAQEEAIDASDPTRIYTYLGGGLKYNDYTNGEYMLETRLLGNVGLSVRDSLLFETGYGWHDGDQAPGKQHTAFDHPVPFVSCAVMAASSFGASRSRLRWRATV